MIALPPMIPPGIHILSERAMLVVSSHLPLQQPNITNVTNCLLQDDYWHHIIDWAGDDDVIVLFRTPSSRAVLSILGGAANPRTSWQGEIGAASIGDLSWSNELRFWPCQDWYPFCDPALANNPLDLKPNNFDSVWTIVDAALPPMSQIDVLDLEPSPGGAPKLILCPGSQPDLHPFHGNSFQATAEQPWALSNWELLKEEHRTPQEWAGGLPVVFLSAASGTTAIRVCLAALDRGITDDPFEHLADLMKWAAPDLFRECGKLVQANIMAMGDDPREQTPNTMNVEAWNLITSGDYDGELLALDESLFDADAVIFDPNLMLIVHAIGDDPFDPCGPSPFGDRAAPLYAIMAHRVLQKLQNAGRLLLVPDETWSVKKILPNALNSARVLLSKIERNRPLVPIAESGLYELGAFSWSARHGLRLETILTDELDDVPPVSCVAASYGLPHRRLSVDMLSKLSSQEVALYYRALALPDPAS